MTLPALCGVYTFLLTGTPIIYSTIPKGRCSDCCEIVDRDDILLMLYTRRNQFKPKNLYLNDRKGLLKSNFNFNHPLVIFLHGFAESATFEEQSSQEIKDAFLKRGNYNVILVDWSELTAAPWYSNAVDNLSIAGKYVARFIKFLLDQGYPKKKIHIIGFSLGAEAAGFVGKKLKKWGITLPRITGLDPAYPLFEIDNNLSPEVAQFVDIIHTDGGIFGNYEALGHVDFYPNNGRPIQPGCALQELSNFNFLGILLGCSHRRSWEYFVESIRNPFSFLASRCEPSKLFGTCAYADGLAFMGMGADKRLRGKFFLNTKSAAPYGDKTFGSNKKPNKMRASDALTLLPEKQNRVQLNNNATTEQNSQENENERILDYTTTADGWNSVSSNSETSFET